MNLEEQGFRYILRPVGGRPHASWVHPLDVKPHSGQDCTDMTDEQFARAVRRLQLWLEARREQV